MKEKDWRWAKRNDWEALIAVTVIPVIIRSTTASQYVSMPPMHGSMTANSNIRAARNERKPSTV